MTSGKPKARSHISRNKKAYWRKGVNLDEVEDFLNVLRFDERDGGQISERKDEELFMIDTARVDEALKLTKRQEAALRKRQQLASEENMDIDSKPSKRVLKKAVKLVNRPQSNTKPLSKPGKQVGHGIVHDLWEEEKAESISAGQEYFDKVTKKRLPRRPVTASHISSLRPAVDVPQNGVSYNPDTDSYEVYLNALADRERKYELREEKVKKNLSLPLGESYVTPAEKLAEESAGLFDDETVNAEGSGVRDESEETLIKVDPRSRKRKVLRKKALESKKREKKKRKELEVKQKENLVFRARKINKEITNTLTLQEKKALLRKKNKALRKLLGLRESEKELEDVDEAFLLPKELPESLRQLKPQGSILHERVKTCQKRNVLPLPGKRKKRSLKKRLKVKEVERRSRKDVAVGTHLKR